MYDYYNYKFQIIVSYCLLVIEKFTHNTITFVMLI